MATIPTNSLSGSGAQQVAILTGTGTDTLVYDKNANQRLYIHNITGGALTVTVDGDGGTTVTKPGLPNIDVSGGYSTAAIGAGELYFVDLPTIDAYCQGTIAVTGNTGAVCWIVQ